jgi:uncharacterized phiE125 gp8 family phage protein
MSLAYVARHVLSQLVQPAVSIAATAVGTPAPRTIVTTATPHYLVTGDMVTIAGADSALNGAHVITRIDATSFSIPVTTAAAGGAAGTVTRTRPREPLTLNEGKLRAGLEWVDGDERDALMQAFISAARQKVEKDVGVSLLSQVRDVFYDALVDPSVITLPPSARPLIEVVSLNWTDSAGIEQIVPATSYIVDHIGARISGISGAVWPTGVRNFQPYRVRIVSGWPEPAAIPPLLLQAVGLLTAHYATAGRDLATVGTIASTTPYGYDEAITPFLELVLP